MNSGAASLLPSSTIMTSNLGAFFCSAKDRRHRSSATQSLKTAMMTLNARLVAVSGLPIGALCRRGAGLQPVELHKEPQNHNLIHSSVGSLRVKRFWPEYDQPTNAFANGRTQQWSEHGDPQQDRRNCSLSTVSWSHDGAHAIPFLKLGKQSGRQDANHGPI